MTVDKVREVIAIYRRKFEEMDIPKREFPRDSLPTSNDDYLAHCYSMLDKMEVFLEEGRIEKVFRWLGFIQGCLWRSGVYTVDELRDHNRSR